MAVYKVLLKASAAKEIDSLPDNHERQRIVERIQALSVNPRPPGCDKLAVHQNRYRVRQGRYRILYEIHDHELVVTVVRVADRKEVYR